MFADPSAYERFMGRWSRLVAPLLVEFADPPERGRVLDVGSGTGSLAMAIAARRPGLHVVGIDSSREYVSHANAAHGFGDRVRFETGDAQQLPFPDAAFDGALSLLVFNFIPDPRRALAELRRVVKPGAGVAAAVWDYTSRMRMLRTFWDAAVSTDPDARKIDEHRMPLCRPGELADLWRQGGLENVREQAIDIDMRFESFADYWDPFLLGQGPTGAYAGSLQGDRLAALRSEVLRRLSLPAENTAFTLPARAWAVSGAVPAAAQRPGPDRT